MSMIKRNRVGSPHDMTWIHVNTFDGCLGGDACEFMVVCLLTLVMASFRDGFTMRNSCRHCYQRRSDLEEEPHSLAAEISNSICLIV